MKHITSALLLALSFGMFACSNMGIEKIDAYKMKFDESFLFGDFDVFINSVGLPMTASVLGDTLAINTKEDIDKIIVLCEEKHADAAYLQYLGFEMEYMYNNYIMPVSIDFRQTEKNIYFNNVTFNGDFSLEQYTLLFPKSVINRTDHTVGSLFQIKTNEGGEDYDHFSIFRKSKDGPFADPIIEFTFKDGKLIYIFFANF